MLPSMLTCLRKPGDPDDQETLGVDRKIRPIGVGSVLLRLVGGVGTRMSTAEFSAIFDPAAEEDERVPFNAGVACPGGMQQIQSAIADVFTATPPAAALEDTLVCMDFDEIAAFQNASRKKTFEECIANTPGNFAWTNSCYGRKKPMYIRREDGSIGVIWCTAGAIQGDPFGPSNHGLSQVAWRRKLQEFYDAGLLAYMDDEKVVCTMRVAAQILIAITEEDGECEIESNTGCRLNISKSRVTSLESAYFHPAEFDLPDAPLTLADISIGEGEPGGEMSFDILWARAANFRQAFRRLLPERLHRFPGIAEPAALMPDSTAAEIAVMRAAAHASRGLSVLGSPIWGTPDFIRTELRKTLTKARGYVEEARRVLLHTGDAPAHQDYLQLLRVTLPARYLHHLAPCASELVEEIGFEFDRLQIDAFTHAVGQLVSTTPEDAPTELLERQVLLDTAFGGRGFVSTMTYVHSIRVGNFALTHHPASRRFPGLHALGTGTLGVDRGPDTGTADNPYKDNRSLFHRERLHESLAICHDAVAQCETIRGDANLRPWLLDEVWRTVPAPGGIPSTDAMHDESIRHTAQKLRRAFSVVESRPSFFLS